jgi:hypothetical protein
MPKYQRWVLVPCSLLFFSIYFAVKIQF